MFTLKRSSIMLKKSHNIYEIGYKSKYKFGFIQSLLPKKLEPYFRLGYISY